MENFEENIENEYRKRFKDFEEMPEDLLWKNIQARIEPEKKRPLVIWWNSLPSPLGVAASLLIGLAVGAYFLIRTSKETQLGHLPRKAVNSHSQAQKSMASPKVNVDGRESSEAKLNGGVQTKPKQLVSPESRIEEKLMAVKATHSIQEQNSLTGESAQKEKAKTADALAETPVVTALKTKKNVAAAEKQTESTVLAKSETTELDKSKQINSKENRLATNQKSEQPAPITGLAAAMTDGVVRDTLFHDVSLLKGKEVYLVIVEKHLQAPEMPTLEIPVLAEEKSRLVFIPPTEIFANVTSTLSYYMFSPNKGDQILVNNFSSSSQRFGFAAQLGFVYPIAKKMDLRTGLSYFSRKSRISYGVIDNSKKSVKVLDDNSIQIIQANSTQNEYRNWQYFELQSDVLYEVKKMQALSLGMKLGVQTSSLNSPLIQARLGYRFSKAIADHWALWLEPAVSVSLSSNRSIENLFMYRTTGFGLNMGVSLLK